MQCGHCWPTPTAVYDTGLPTALFAAPGSFIGNLQTQAAPTVPAPWLTPQPTWTPTVTNTPGPTPTSSVVSHSRVYPISSSGTVVDGYSPNGRYNTGSTWWIDASYGVTITLDTAINPLPAGAHIYAVEWQGPGFFQDVAGKVRMTLNGVSVVGDVSIAPENTTTVYFPSNVSIAGDTSIDFEPMLPAGYGDGVPGVYLAVRNYMTVYYRTGIVATPTPVPTWTPFPSPTSPFTPEPSSTPRLPGGFVRGNFDFSCAEPGSVGAVGNFDPIASLPQYLVSTGYQCYTVIPQIGPLGPFDLVFVEIPEIFLEQIDLCVTFIEWPIVQVFGINGLQWWIGMAAVMAIYRRVTTS